MLQRITRILNDMRPRQLLLLAGIAAVLMFGAILAGINSVSKDKAAVQPTETPPPQPAIEKRIPVVVAKQNIQPHTRIQETMLQMKELPEDLVPEGAIKSFDDVKDVQLKVSIFAGDILTIQKVFAETSDEGFTGNIPANCRAVSISVNDVTGVAGFARPGDRVDLLLVEKGKHSVTTNLLLQNVPLLSINQDHGASAPVGENGVPTAAIVNPSIATFALPPEDALKLISASKLGEIYLSLRPSKPQRNYVEPMEYTMESVDAPQPVRETVPVIPAASVPAAAVVPAVPKIEIIAGDQIVQSNTPTVPVAPAKTAPVAQGGPTTNQPLPIIPSTGVAPIMSESTPVPSPPIVSPPANQ